MDESTLNKNAAALIRKRGGWARKLHGGIHGRGLPDIVGAYRGHALLLEGKLPGKEKTLTKLQAQTLKEGKDAGAVTAVFTTTTRINQILDQIDRHYERRTRPPGTKKKSTGSQKHR